MKEYRLLTVNWARAVEVFLMRNALLRGSTGDVHAVIPISLMRQGETRAELVCRRAPPPR